MAETSGRAAHLDELLAAASCRALLIVARSSGDPDLASFTGRARLGQSLLVAARGRPPGLAYLTPMERDEAALSGLALLTPEQLDVARWSRNGAPRHQFFADLIARALHLAEVAPGRIALAGTAPLGYLQAACQLLAQDGWSFVPGEPLVAELRRCKTEAELTAIRAAAAGTVAALRRAAELLAATAVENGELRLGSEPLTVGRLRSELGRTLAAHGLEQPEGNIVAPGAEGAVPHSVGTDARVLRPGESLIVDLFPRGRPGRALFADCTRTFCVGTPPPALAAAHAAVAESLALAHREARAGVRGFALQQHVCDHLAAAGFPTPLTDPGTTRGYVHGLGHGVGYELHEQPSFQDDGADTAPLAAGDVFTLEPGIYEPEAGFAVRLEDLCHLTEAGCENLTPLPYDLDPRRWS